MIADEQASPAVARIPISPQDGAIQSVSSAPIPAAAVIANEVTKTTSVTGTSGLRQRVLSSRSVTKTIAASAHRA